MLRHTVILGCALLLVAAASGWAQNVGEGFEPEPDQSTTRVGTRGANFLEIPVGARSQALGATGAALDLGPESIAWNVAATANAEYLSFGWQYSELFDDTDIAHQFGGVLVPITETWVVGLGLVALTSGDIPRTTERFPEGGDPLFGSTFEWSSTAISLTFANRITDRLNIGVGLKLVTEGIDEAKANWVGVDLGALFRTGLLGTTLGASIVNLGGEASFSGRGIERIVTAGTDAFPTSDNVPISFDTDDVALPTAFRFSLLADVTGTPEAWLPMAPVGHNVRVLFDVFDAIDTALEPSVGVEYDYKGLIFARGGKRFRNEDRTEFRNFWDNASIGGGLRIPLLNRQLGFDYAYTRVRNLGNTQTFSVQWGG